jgi:hypothetical protein
MQEKVKMTLLCSDMYQSMFVCAYCQMSLVLRSTCPALSPFRVRRIAVKVTMPYQEGRLPRCFMPPGSTSPFPTPAMARTRRVPQ